MAHLANSIVMYSRASPNQPWGFEHITSDGPFDFGDSELRRLTPDQLIALVEEHGRVARDDVRSRQGGGEQRLLDIRST